MPDLQFQKVVQSNIDVLDFGVRDLEAIVTASGTILYSSTGYGGGVSSYFLSNGGSVSLVDTALFDLDADAGQGGEIEVVDGGDTLLVGGVAGGKVLRFDLVGLGQIGGMNEMNVAGSGSYAALAETDSGHILTADQAGSGVLTYTMGNNGLTLRNTEADTAASHAVHVSDVKLVTLSNGTEVLLSASQGERGISSYRMSGFDPVLADSMGPDEGAGIMIPTDMAVMQMGTLSFVIVASMPGSGNSGALTVMQIDGNGQLSVTDHVLDSLDMRFGAVQAIDTIEINGRWYVAAGGAMTASACLWSCRGALCSICPRWRIASPLPSTGSRPSALPLRAGICRFSQPLAPKAASASSPMIWRARGRPNWPMPTGRS
jgi:hypothetical protein